MRTAGVLPLKSFGRAKSRLGGRSDRAALAEAMADDVVDALLHCEGIEEVVIVARERPSWAGVSWILDEAEAGHVPAALLGVRAALERGYDRVLLVPGDCPAVDPGEIADLLRTGSTRDRFSSPTTPRSAVIVPDRHGTGTNALLLSPPDVITPAFGAGSFSRHLALADAAGAEVHVARPPSLLMDVDTPEDLEALLDALPPGAAPRTRALLPLPT